MLNSSYSRLKTYRPMENAEIISRFPSVGSLSAHQDVSARYQVIPTIGILDMLKKEGWQTMQVKEVNARNAKVGFQKHMIRLQHVNSMSGSLSVGDEIMNAVLVNSHDRTCAYQFYTGIFRLVCANGLIVGNSQFERVSVRHVGFKPEDVIEASYKIINSAPEIMNNVKEMKQITLTDSEKTVYANAAMNLLYDETETPAIKPEKLLTVRRSNDRSPDLWRTFNTVQENIMQGGLRGYNQEKRRYVSTRKVNNIDKDVRLNRALWTLTEEMANLKMAA